MDLIQNESVMAVAFELPEAIVSILNPSIPKDSV
jgi:hypothetical protein